MPLAGLFLSLSLSMQEHEKHFIFPLLIAFQISMRWLEESKIFRWGEKDKAIVERFNLESKVGSRRAMKRHSDIPMQYG